MNEGERNGIIKNPTLGLVEDPLERRARVAQSPFELRLFPCARRRGPRSTDAARNDHSST